MMYHGYGMGMGAAWTLIAFAIGLPTLLIVVGMILAQVRRSPVQPAPSDPIPGAERILADRFAQGQIDADEYAHRLRTLRAERR